MHARSLWIVGAVSVATLSQGCGGARADTGRVSARTGNTREGLVNAHERRDNRRDLRDDQRDVMALTAIRDAWERAVDAGDGNRERAVDARLAAWLRDELRESATELREARRESRRSVRERNRSRREAQRSGTREDRRDLRDDRRDLRDDRRDQRRARIDRDQTRAIAIELQGMHEAFAAGTATPALYARKRLLLNQLADMAVAEVREDREEIREDRRERREDRRERREDLYRP